MFLRTAIASALALWIPAVAMAGGDGPKILSAGDAAPAIDATHWVKGDPVEFEPGKVYVVEFWATWCGPCKLSIPHLSELQAKYKDYDVTFVGISDEKLPTVVKFLSTGDTESVLWYDKMRYTVATDPDLSVHNAYMRAAARETIPSAFIVGKDTRIEWIGNPMDGFDDALAAVVRDDWDRDAFRARYEESVAPIRARLRAQAEVQAYVDAKEWDKALAAIDALGSTHRDRTPLQMSLYRAMVNASEPKLATALGKQLLAANADNPGLLNSIAWFTAISEADEVDLAFAQEVAERACDITNFEAAAILDTLARVHYEKGDLAAALKWQRKALEHAGNDMEAQDIRQTLAKYEDEAGDD